MKREIEFRGYSKELKRWVYGGICGALNDVQIIHKQGTNLLQHTLVDPESVGQFVGKTDINKKKIFEGDRINVLIDRKIYLKMKDVEVCFINGSFGIFNKNGYFEALSAYSDIVEYEVTGNIYENKIK